MLKLTYDMACQNKCNQDTMTWNAELNVICIQLFQYEHTVIMTYCTGTAMYSVCNYSTYI